MISALFLRTQALFSSPVVLAAGEYYKCPIKLRRVPKWQNSKVTSVRSCVLSSTVLQMEFASTSFEIGTCLSAGPGISDSKRRLPI
jgi:hypothetical protein